MVPRMKLRFILLVGAAFLAVSWPAPGRAQSAIASGTWTGYFERNISINNNISGVAISAAGYGRGNIELLVSPDGKVTGSMTGYHAEVSWSAPAVNVSGGCTIDIDISSLQGTVKDGPDYLPVFNLNLGEVTPQFICDPDAGENSAPPKSVVMQAKTASSGQITGEAVRFDTDLVEQVLNAVAQTGAQTTITEYWELNSSGATVEVISAERELYFLEEVPFQNTYEAIVDWHDNPPGTVDFSLAGQSQNVPDEAPASASFELGEVPAGTQPLLVTAITADGTPSGSNTYDVIIVPLEPWAQGANFQAAELKMDEIIPVVIYRGQVGLPPAPIELPYLDMSWLPALGGKWGIPPFQLDINLSATSGGGLSDPEPITGSPGLFLGGDAPALAIQVDGEAVTDLTPTALLLDHGQVNFNLGKTTFDRKVGVVDLVPGLSTLYSIPILGDLIQSLNGVVGISLQTIVSAKGQADLGVAADQSVMVLTTGKITPAIELKAKPGANLFDLAWVELSGGGQGEFTIRIAPDPSLEQCQFSLLFGAGAGIQGLFSESFTESYNLVQCSAVTYNGKPGLAIYLPAGLLDTNLRAAGETTGRQDPLAYTTRQPPAGSFEILAAGLSPQSAYDLAVGPDGRQAFAYLAIESPEGSQGLRLSIYDGKAWGQPLALSQSDEPEFSPAVGFTEQGEIVVVWVRAGQPAPAPGKVPGQEFFNSWEIQYAQVNSDSGEVLSRGSLTQDQTLDFAPQLAQAADGSLRLAWMESPAMNLWGPADQPNQLLTTVWSGGQWAEVHTVTDRLVGSLGYRLAAFRQDRALIVSAEDLDGDPATAADREMFAFSLDGNSWQTIQLSENTVLDDAPLAAFTSAGEPVVLWEQDLAPVSLRGKLEGAALPLQIDPTPLPDLGAAVLLAGGAEDLLLAWPGFDPPQSQVWYSRLPPGASSWDSPARLAGGLDGPAGLTAGVEPSGQVVLALADQHTGPGNQGIRGPVETADLGEIKAPLLQPWSGALPQAARGAGPGLLAPVWLIALCVVAVLAMVVLGGVVVILLRRRRPA